MSTPGRKKWVLWIAATTAVALLQIYFLVHRLSNQPESVARLQWIFLGCAVVGLVGSLVMFSRKEP